MDSKKMRIELEKRLSRPDRIFSFDREKDQLRIENKQTGKGITVSLPGIIAKWQLQKEKAIDEVVYYVEEGLQAMDHDVQLSGKEKAFFQLSVPLPSQRKPKKESRFCMMTIQQKREFIMLWI